MKSPPFLEAGQSWSVTPDHRRREYIASLSVLSSAQPFGLIEGAAMAEKRAL